jgi:anti-anti-sigma factor
MPVKLEERGSTTRILHLDGEIDLANAGTVAHELLDELELGSCGSVLVDCRDLRFLDACGMSMMLRVQQRAAEVHVALVWSHLGGLPLRVVRVVGLDGYLRIVE